jgi:hypothetical protein
MQPRHRDKIAIVVFGNLATGKSSVCTELQKLMPEYSFVSADDYRKEYLDSYGYLEEQKGKTQLEEALLSAENLIWETTLTGAFSQRVIKKLGATHKIVKCKIEAAPLLCFNRFCSRPLPATVVKKNLRDNIYSLDEFLHGIKADLSVSSEYYSSVVIAHMIKNFADAV